MTYFQFLAIFLVLPLLVMALGAYLDGRGKHLLPDALRQLPAWIPLWGHVLVAVAYTTPWDNYLVATGVWYYNPGLVAGITIGWVPVEEYIFFVLQTLLSGLWLLWLAKRLPFDQQLSKHAAWLRIGPTLTLGAAWCVSIILLSGGWAPLTYLGLIQAWAIPPIMLQLVFGGDILWKHRWAVALALGSLSLYLAAADALAIGSGIWTISPQQSSNIYLGGVLPIEEFIFFLATNTLVIFGTTLALSPDSYPRARLLLQRLPSRSPRPNKAVY